MQKKAVFIGLTGIDYVYYLNTFPDENSKCKTEDYAQYIGGPAANAAITYACLGGDATLITAFGNSREGDIITQELEDYGVKVINACDDEELPGISNICISPNGNRTIISGQKKYANIVLPDMKLEEYDFALFDCNQQDVSLPLLDKLSCEIVLDAGSYKENVEKFLERANIVISSEKFVDDNGSDIFHMNYPSIVHRAMTRGEKAIITSIGEIEVKKVECVDSLAAGDIFHGAFCFGYYEKKLDFESALQFAADIATESVKYKGPREWIKQRS